ncbi:fimbrial protein [Pluralibacter gergoviae]|nr:fimbrial protein [Pluralibacter gergoviae]ELW9440060.1 fimbrial protein [Pluralibacter gergoviae]
MKRSIKRLVGMALLTAAFSVQAYVQGEGEPEGEAHVYNIDLNSLDIANNRVGGRTPEFTWNLGSNYVVNFHCDSGSIINEAISYTTKSTMQPSGNNRFKLNDYLDVEASVWIAGNVNKYIPAPFTNYSNRLRQNSCFSVPGNSVARVNNVQSGSRGKVVFIVTKPIINGINITGQALLDLAGDLGGQAIPSTPISRVIISSGLITVPDRCVFNKGQKIAVEFGTLPNAASKLDGNNYKQSVPIHVECEGGSFSQGALNIELGIQTTTASGTASFNHQLLGTLSNGQKRSDLGILLQDTNGRPVVPDQFYEMKGFYKNQGDWNLTAAPMANAGAGSVKEGEFEASATVVAKFQ